jgi:hypothetical protein
MSMFRIVSGALVAALGVVVLPGMVAAQDAPPTPPQQATELVFEREVFLYPQFERRNPFRPLGVGDAGAVRFEQLRLAGTIVSDDPSESVAILSTAQVTVSEDGSQVTAEEGESWYAKVGQTIGNVRILEIHLSQIVVEVEEFGIAEQKIMQLQTRRLGGTS